MINAVIFIVLIVVICIALRSTVRRILGKASCCSGGSSVIREHKKLDAPTISKKSIKINGMKCENCAARVEHSVNKLDGAACEVNLKTETAQISLSREISGTELKDAIEKAGCTVAGM